MEPRTNIAEFDRANGSYTLHTGTGRGVAGLRDDLARVLGVEADKVRVVCGDMGGNFGTRNFFYPEYALLPWAARRVGRPIKWTCERGEDFLSDYQGRDLAVTAELALDADGKFLAVRASNLSNLGAQAASFVSLQKGIGLMSGVYDIVKWTRSWCITNASSMVASSTTSISSIRMNNSIRVLPSITMVSMNSARIGIHVSGY